jgi:hypothetical protein
MKVKSQYESCFNVSPLVLTTQTQLSTLVQFEVKWQVHWAKNYRSVRHDTMQAIFKTVELPFCLSSGIYILSLYSQHILQPCRTAVPLTKTLSDGVQ